jgi:ATP-dependent Clp protease ATP-binding subunit ClpA
VRSITCSRQDGRKSPAQTLVAIFGEKDSHAVYFLNQQEVSRLDVVNHPDGVAIGQEHAQPGADAAKDPEAAMSRAATRWRISPATQRTGQARQDRSADRPCRGNRAHDPGASRRKNNPLYVGEAGVGKTALAEGLAKRTSKAKCPMCSRIA